MSIDDLVARNFDLDIKNPHKVEAVREYSSAELMEQLAASLQQTQTLMDQLKQAIG